MREAQEKSALALANGDGRSCGGKSSMSAWKLVGIYLCVSLLGGLIRRAFVSVMPLPGVDPDIVVGGTELTAAVLVILAVLRWSPGMAKRFSFEFNLKFLPFACALGLLGGNVCLAIQKTWGEVTFFNFDVLTLALSVLIAPVVEEILCRGIILESFLQKHSVLFSVLLTTILFAFDHANFWPALAGQIMLSTVYLCSRRSLTMSMIAHAISNLATGFPSDVLRYTHYFKSW